MNFKLSPEIKALIATKVAGGEYKSVNAFLEQAIQQTLQKGLERAKPRDSSPSYDDVEDLLVDSKTLQYYARDADDTVTLEEVRHILSKISGSLADDLIAERG